MADAKSQSVWLKSERHVIMSCIINKRIHSSTSKFRLFPLTTTVRVQWSTIQENKTRLWNSPDAIFVCPFFWYLPRSIGSSSATARFAAGSFRPNWLISHGWKYCWLVWCERKILFKPWIINQIWTNKPKRTSCRYMVNWWFIHESSVPMYY